MIVKNNHFNYPLQRQRAGWLVRIPKGNKGKNSSHRKKTIHPTESSLKFGYNPEEEEEEEEDEEEEEFYR